MLVTIAAEADQAGWIGATRQKDSGRCDIRCAKHPGGCLRTPGGVGVLHQQRQIVIRFEDAIVFDCGGCKTNRNRPGFENGPRTNLNESDVGLLIHDRTGRIDDQEFRVGAHARRGDASVSLQDPGDHGVRTAVQILVETHDAVREGVCRGVPDLAPGSEHRSGDHQGERLAARVQEAVPIVRRSGDTHARPGDATECDCRVAGIVRHLVAYPAVVLIRVQPAIAVVILVGTVDHHHLPQHRTARAGLHSNRPGAGDELVRRGVIHEGGEVNRLDVVMCVVEGRSRGRPPQRPLPGREGPAQDIDVAIIDEVIVRAVRRARAPIRLRVGRVEAIVGAGRLDLQIEVIDQFAAAARQAWGIGPAERDPQLPVRDDARPQGCHGVQPVDPECFHGRLVGLVVDRRFTGSQHVIDNRPGSRVFDGRHADAACRRVVRQRQDLVEDDATVPLDSVADDAYVGTGDHADVHRTRARNEQIALLGPGGDGEMLPEVRAGHQRRAHQAAGQVRHSIVHHAIRCGIEALCVVVADERAGRRGEA